ncbi:MAG: MFS transporter [Acidobacteria bacterium]|nr:MFS transporter [Acidobacteriota bacterium]
MNNEQKKHATYALWVLFAINMMNFFDRQIFASVSKPIIEEWNLSHTALGFIGTAFILVYMTVGVPFGIWADRGSRTKLLAFAVAIWSIFTAASGVAWGYSSMFVARLGVGFGEAGCAPAGNSLIGDLYPANKRGRAIGLFMLGLPVGIFLSNILSGIIAKAFGWRMTFLVATIPGLILALLALRIKEPPRGASETFQADDRPRGLLSYFRVLAIPTMWWIILSGALHNFNAYAVNSFIPLYLGLHHGLDIQQANLIAAIVLGAVGVIGLIAGGWAADWARKKSPRGRMIVAALALLISTPCVYFAIGQPSGALVPFMVLMGFGWMLIYFYYVAVYPAIQDVVEPSLRGSAMALYFFGMYLILGAYGTWITGYLSDTFANQAMVAAGATTLAPFRAIGLQKAFYVVPIVSLLLTLVLFAGSLTIAKDMEKLQKGVREAVPDSKSDEIAATEITAD